MRIAVLPTGKAELVGLAASLGRLFPGHEFVCLARRDEEPFDSFTSSRLPGPSSATPTNVDKIVEMMASVVSPGGRREFDLVLVVDDLELCNADQPGVVVQVFRDAVGRHMRKLAGLRAGVVTRVQQALLERASFHLAVPMIEAWLFADPQGPANAGVPTQRLPPQWAAHQCPEDFLTLDHNYASAPACAEWLKLPLPKQTKSSRPQWLIDARERHPKAFLSWLCREEVPRKCSAYRETHGGADALRDLDWQAILARPPGEMRFLRALVDDLAEACGNTSLRQTSVASETSRMARRTPQVLRNI